MIHNPSSLSHRPLSMLSSNKGFTLLELTIVIALLALITTAVMVLLNPVAQINKADDAKRKADLATLNRIFEDYYNDKGCYPKPSDVCYDAQPPKAATNVCQQGLGSGLTIQSQVCHICGDEATSPSFSPYLTKLPCDPQHSTQDYLYEVPVKSGIACYGDSNSGLDCPNWYHLYSYLSNLDDPDSKNLGCAAGACGLQENTVQPPVLLSPYPFGYSYGVVSPNSNPATAHLGHTTSFYGFDNQNNCKNAAGDYDTCLYGPGHHFLKCYASRTNCCAANHGASGCP